MGCCCCRATGIRSLLLEVAQPWGECARTIHCPQQPPSPWHVEQQQGFRFAKANDPERFNSFGITGQRWGGQAAGQGVLQEAGSKEML